MKQEIDKKESGLAHVGLIITTIVLVAGLAFAGWWVWSKNKTDSGKTKNSTSDQSEDQEKQIENQELAPEGWKFYENSQAGFSFYYPPDWGEIRLDRELYKGESYKFSSESNVGFEIHKHDLDLESIEFGNIEPAVIDVFFENEKPVVRLAPGLNAFRDFSKEQVVKELGQGKICLAEDYFAETYVEGANPATSYTYFAYCGLKDDTFGAFTFSSGQLDRTKSETQNMKGEINKLLSTFNLSD